MAKRKGSISSPFTHQLIPEHGDRAKRGDVVDRNACSYFSEPRAAGHGGVPEVFFSGPNGDVHHGPISGKAAVSSPMGSTKK